MNEDSGSVDVSEKEKWEDPWKSLRQEVKDSLSPRYDEQLECYLEEGMSDEDSKTKVHNFLFPVYRTRLNKKYLYFIK